MNYATTVIITLVIYKIMLIAIGFYANQKTSTTEDYFIGGRGLGSWLAAISSAASASSAWTLLGMSGAAYAMGLSAIWIVPAVIIQLDLARAQITEKSDQTKINHFIGVACQR